MIEAASWYFLLSIHSGRLRLKKPMVPFPQLSCHWMPLIPGAPKDTLRSWKLQINLPIWVGVTDFEISSISFLWRDSWRQLIWRTLGVSPRTLNIVTGRIVHWRPIQGQDERTDYLHPWRINTSDRHFDRTQPSEWASRDRGAWGRPRLWFLWCGGGGGALR